jgi:hypothetical protein
MQNLRILGKGKTALALKKDFQMLLYMMIMI